MSDNGPLFVSKDFSDFVKAFDINHCKTGVYVPQANASERVNQSILAAILSYLGKNHNEWDLHLYEIECALRSAVYSEIGITHASAYKIARTNRYEI